MEFCGAGSLQDIYQGERKGKGIHVAPAPPIPLSSLPLCLLGLSLRSIFHTVSQPLLWAWPGLEDARDTVVTEWALSPVLQDLRVQPQSFCMQ